MKTVEVYFGIDKDGNNGSVIFEVNDDFTAEQFFSKGWAGISFKNGARWINTQKVLWFNIKDEPEDKE